LGLDLLELSRLFETAVSRRNGLTRLKGAELERALLDLLEECDRVGIRMTYGINGLDPELAERIYVKSGGRLGCKDFRSEVVKGRCNMPWTYMGFELGGVVSPCCGGCDGFDGGPNAFLRSPDSLFNNKGIVALRAMTMAGFTPRVCRKMCYKDYDPSLVLKSPKEKDAGGKEEMDFAKWYGND
jgi:hypothetical protein